MKNHLIKTLMVALNAIVFAFVSLAIAEDSPHSKSNQENISEENEATVAKTDVQAIKSAENIEPVETCKSLPIDSLICAAKPLSDLVVNVKDYGATGDGKTDDTKAIQAAVNGSAGSGGTILVPAGTYLINAEKSIRLGSDLTFRMEEGVVLKAIPNDKENFNILLLKNVSNVTVLGGILQGDRNTHKGKTGEWGMGVQINNSSNITVENVISKDNWGDGFYINNNSHNLHFCGVVADNNRRHGIAIVSADGLVVKNSTFQRANGYVGGGLDIEPNAGHGVQNYEITHSKFIFNEGCGITTSVPQAHTGKSFVRNGVISDNLLVKNGKLNSYTAGILVSQQEKIQVINNIIVGNAQTGILIVGKSKENLIKNNTIINNGNDREKKFGAGIYLDESSGNQIENNHISGSSKHDIYDDNGKNILEGNRAEKVHKGHSLF